MAFDVQLNRSVRAEISLRISSTGAGLLQGQLGASRARSGEIRIFDSSGDVERTIPFNEADRNL
jgi:hypothetical protein